MDVHHGGVVLVKGYIYVSNWLHNSDGLSGTWKSIGIVKGLLYLPKICFIYMMKKEAMSD